VDAIDRVAVRSRDFLQLFFRLGQSDVEARLAAGAPLEQELERERRLSGAGVSFHQIDPIRRETAFQQLVEPGNPRALDRRLFGCWA
jgi:hypothetical protein